VILSGNMRKKTVLILFGKNRKNKLAKILTEYEDLYAYGDSRGIVFCRTPISYFDEKNKVFKRAQFFVDGEWVWKKNIIPDIVYDKSPFYLDKKLMRKREKISFAYPFYNSLKLSELLSNKWFSYKEFEDFSPKAVLVSGKKDFGKIKSLSSARVIIKPLTGSGGKGIEIFDKDKVNAKNYPFFAQELVEARRGIDGFVRGAHDLRVIVINEKPFYAFLRIPQKNSLIANLSKGGKIKVVLLKKLPASVFSFIAKIRKKLRKYGNKLYSIDMIIDDSGKPWIIEMNSRPGIILEKEELAYREYFFNNLINFFKHAK
jgi:hypothetical protein